MEKLNGLFYSEDENEEIFFLNVFFFFVLMQ